MALLDLKLPAGLARALKLPINDVRKQQLAVLKKLLKTARYTQFGQQYKFDEILISRHPGKLFQKFVPTFDYNKLHDAYWYRALEGVPDVCWPGRVKYFALSSGTSEAASKYIPITKDLIKSNMLTSRRQLYSLAGYHDVNFGALPRGWFMLGGSTTLQKGPTYYAGDLSGIQQKNIPFWLKGLYKPGKKIARESDWAKKIDEIVEQAPNWDIGFILGVPAWLQLCMEKIIARYQLNTIHDIWPNLSFYVHGGVAMEPYKKGIEKLLARPITYIETYLASEGFLASQTRQHAKGMKLALHNNIFFEFVPFDDKNFDADGQMLDNPEALMIHEIEEGKEYALLISTNGGAWRYLIGDTIRLVDKAHSEIIITGRTKHFLNLVGEHLSVENMNKAIETVSSTLNISIPEFTIVGMPVGNFFGHHWYVACNDPVNAELLAQKIDEQLKLLNDDYEVERRHALKQVVVTVLPEAEFLDFMRSKGKIGGQHKFPRVLKGKMLTDWEQFLANYKQTIGTSA
ncbi:MAG: GH3 auxin-responsive promoter [Bacteroidetes bacterium]|nr:MAG: GH3 auxin-responsive promoter [Bacteroidota bacterium]